MASPRPPVGNAESIAGGPLGATNFGRARLRERPGVHGCANAEPWTV